MNLYEREFFISRIKSGTVRVKYGDTTYIFDPPTSDIEYEANEIFLETYNMCKEDGILEDEGVLKLLIDKGLWSLEKENELDEIVPKHIEYWKKEIYNSFLQSKTKETLRKYLQAAEEEQIRLFSIRHKFDYMTCAGIANFAKSQFLIKNSARNVDWNKVDIGKMLNIYNLNLVNNNIIRELARTSPWSTEWQCLKKNGRVFANDNLTIEQRNLITWSITYDNVYESMDSPPDEIIDDDDALDGWFIIQREKRIAQKNKSIVEKKFGGKDYDEVFLPAQTPEDARKIMSLNTPAAQRDMQNRMEQIKKHGNVRHHELSDVKRDLQLKARQSQRK